MKKLFAATAVAVALVLGGCDLSQLGTAIQLGTASVANPVTPDRLYQMESAVTLVFAGLETWKKSCVQGVIPPACKAQIAAVQVYTRQIPPYLAQLRGFVKTNNQVNAIVVWNNIIQVVDTVKANAATNGVTISTVAGV